MAQPLKNGDTGRDTHGRFMLGNRLGRGNPFARRSAELRREFYAEVTPMDLKAVCRMLVEKAKSGDLMATKLLLLWVIGKPDMPVDPDHLTLQLEGLHRPL